MSDFLKGNFETARPVKAKNEEGEQSLEDKFESAALKRLGGSMAFVSKKAVTWSLDDDSE